jgi:hypothetical protein
LRSQFVAVVILRDLARTLRGKISPVTTQAMGPLGCISGVVGMGREERVEWSEEKRGMVEGRRTHVEAKKKM